MHRDSLEKAYWEALIGSPQGRWLIRTLMQKSGCMTVPNRDFSSKDNYHAGRREIIWEHVVMQLTKHFGFESLDRVMKEN